MATTRLEQFRSLPRLVPALSLRCQAALLVCLLIATAVVTRVIYIGDPVLGTDEDFYLLVGDRMWQGAIPYVDIWDRKPIGLFLLYAAMRPFSSDGIIAYQVTALVFAAATAFVIMRIASRFVDLCAAAIGGVVYLIYLPMMAGAGGQAGVFYNLFVATAALLIVKSGETLRPPLRTRLSVGAMLLVGIAFQIKTSVVFEGAAFGLYLVVRDGRTGVPMARRGVNLVAWLLAVSLPTALAGGYYVFSGHGAAWWQAMVTSALSKKEPAGFSESAYLVRSAILMAPLLIVALVAVLRGVRSATPARFLVVWAGVAVAAFFAIGHYYTFYAQPALVPLCILAATVTETPLAMAAVLSLLLAWYGLTTSAHRDRVARHRTAFAALVEALQPYTRYGCLYLNVGPPAAYLATGSCLPTRFVFPEHLSLAAEAAITSGPAAMQALLAGKPSAIVVGDAEYVRAYGRPRNVVDDAILKAGLDAHYRLKATLPDPDLPGRLQLFVRRELP